MNFIAIGMLYEMGRINRHFSLNGIKHRKNIITLNKSLNPIRTTLTLLLLIPHDIISVEMPINIKRNNKNTGSNIIIGKRIMFAEGAVNLLARYIPITSNAIIAVNVIR